MQAEIKIIWAHHISTQPFLYVIHDRGLAFSTLGGNMKTARGGQGQQSQNKMKNNPKQKAKQINKNAT